MKIDWNKARTIAAHRFEEVIIACNKGDAGELRALMESGMAVPEDYELEDEPDERYRYLDENNCFTADNGYICAMIESTAPLGNRCLLPYIAIKQDNKVVWVIIPYAVEIGSEYYNKKPAIIYTDELNDAINSIITADMEPAIYAEVKASAMV